MVFFSRSPEEEAKPRKAFRFENFADQIASVDYSIVYQLAGAANLTKVQNDIFWGNYVLFLLIFNCLIVLPLKNENRIKHR